MKPYKKNKCPNCKKKNYIYMTAESKWPKIYICSKCKMEQNVYSQTTMYKMRILLYFLLHKNLGCKRCGNYSHKSNTCNHPKNIKRENCGDFWDYKGNALWYHWHRNKKQRCRKYHFGSNQCTPHEYTIIPEEYPKLRAIVNEAYR